LKRLHRLIAIQFLDNPENKPEINHKNSDRLDYHLDNLEWATHQENMEHACHKGRHTHSFRKIVQYSINGEFIKEWNSCRDAAKTF
jgi:hypothetical protein